MVNVIKDIDELNKIDIESGGIIPFSFSGGELYFLFGRETKELKGDDRALWGDFGGNIKKEKENNLEGLIREFWEGTNGIFGTVEGTKKYLRENFNKLLVLYLSDYKGVILFLPIEYDKKFERIFYTTTILYKHILDKKNEIHKARQRGLLEKDMIQWFTLNDILKQKKRFRKKNQELINAMSEIFSC